MSTKELVERLRECHVTEGCHLPFAQAADEIERLERDLLAKQAEMDALMLEYCPEEIPQEQRDEWAKHQRAVSPKEQAAIDAALTDEDKS